MHSGQDSGTGRQATGGTPGAPRLAFLVAGAQKCGTTALAQYLSRHPGLALPAGKEAHVFDDPGFDPAWGPAEVEARFAPFFAGADPAALRGDATPATLFLPGALERAARCYPDLRWIVLLRDPVERALSHYFMARRRGHERLPLLAALLAEPWRAWRGARSADGFALRKFSYVARSRYARQLDRLFRHVPRAQVLLLRSADLRRDPAAVLARTCEFLGVPPPPAGEALAPVFEGGYERPPAWSPGLWWLRWRLAGETRALARRHGLDLDEKTPPPG